MGAETEETAEWPKVRLIEDASWFPTATLTNVHRLIRNQQRFIFVQF